MDTRSRKFILNQIIDITIDCEIMISLQSPSFPSATDIIVIYKDFYAFTVCFTTNPTTLQLNDFVIH